MFIIRIMHGMDDAGAIRHLLRLDLNLLKALDALFQARQITEAGRMVGLSQPAMSHALTRLRAAFGDPLFTRAAGGLVPTARCVALAGAVRHALGILQQAMAAAEPFDPASSRRHFRIGMNDLVSTTVLPELVRRLRQVAPGVSLEAIHLPRATAPGHSGLPGLLDENRADLALGHVGAMPPRLRVQRLGEEAQVCILARNHPAARRALDLPAFAAMAHVKVSSFADRKGWIDEELELRGLRRHVAVVVPHFTAAALIVARTDLIATVPHGSAETALAGGGLAVLDCPLPRRPHPLEICWPQARDDDPGLVWLRRMLADSVPEAVGRGGAISAARGPVAITPPGAGAGTP